jgi:hypothetical protein
MKKLLFMMLIFGALAAPSLFAAETPKIQRSLGERQMREIRSEASVCPWDQRDKKLPGDREEPSREGNKGGKKATSAADARG